MIAPTAQTSATHPANNPTTTDEQPGRRMLRNKSTGERFEAPANWTFDPHSQKERRTRDAAEQRAEVTDRRDILIIGAHERWRAKPPERRGTWEQFLRAVNNLAERAGVVLSTRKGLTVGTGKITKSIVESARNRLDLGPRRATCQESKCGRDPGSPCYGRPWVDPRTWHRLDVVERFRRSRDQRIAYMPSPGRGGEVRSATGSPSDHPNTEGEGMWEETAYVRPPPRARRAPPVEQLSAVFREAMGW